MFAGNTWSNTTCPDGTNTDTNGDGNARDPSYLVLGNQKNTGDPASMHYGVSITDACIDWATTEQLIVSAHEQLLGRDESVADAYAPRYKVG